MIRWSVSHFKVKSRNVWLGLASKRFNPFHNLIYTILSFTSKSLDAWNKLTLECCCSLPIQKARKQYRYVSPTLIDELKDLQIYCLETYDASRNKTFWMCTALLWTINYFLVYTVLSGWRTKGMLAYPCCVDDTCYERTRMHPWISTYGTSMLSGRSSSFQTWYAVFWWYHWKCEMHQNCLCL